ncbi:C40 family peptidase [Sulfurivermis fontis]|uniref:C40 family peptidase n=1 Tax=Sulfurivermis fontis TaxID=1972068 RepID=UPI000FDBF8BB|nr:C40 family peptidase [Sulfurivermis fontis]
MRALLLLGMTLGLAACGSLHPPAAQRPVHQPAPAMSTAPMSRAVVVAQQMVGKPYRYGGNTPRGFDCSGLVQYSYGQAGKAVPRSTTEQYSRTRTIPYAQRAPGDLLFFRIDGKPSHVGIYLGNDRFVHAPSSGKQVEYASLANDYWSRRLVKVGRF